MSWLWSKLLFLNDFSLDVIMSIDKTCAIVFCCSSMLLWMLFRLPYSDVRVA